MYNTYSIYIHTLYNTYIYIYTYKKRERKSDRERERDGERGGGEKGETNRITAIDTAPGLDQRLRPVLVAAPGCLKEPRLVLSLNATDLLHFKRCDPGCAYVRPCVFIYFYLFCKRIGITLEMGITLEVVACA